MLAVKSAYFFVFKAVYLRRIQLSLCRTYKHTRAKKYRKFDNVIKLHYICQRVMWLQ